MDLQGIPKASTALRRRRWLAGLFFLGLCTHVAADSLDDLTGPWILMVDDHPVASRTNVTRTYHPFQKHAGNPVLVPTEPWEEDIAYIYGTVMPNETQTGYRMWYHTLRVDDPNNDGSNILYAESTDGITWTKPILGIRSWHGSTANNMIYVRPGNSGITSVMHTPWNPDPQRRYTFMNFDSGGFWGAYSSDGVHTSDLPNNPVITQAGDVGQFTWDPHTQQFLGYVKLNSFVNGLQRRSVGLTTTTDIASWPIPSLIFEPDTFDDRWVPAGTVQRTHFYGLSVFPYQSMYLAFLWIFRATDIDGYYIGPVYSEIVSSHDGINWIREEGDRPPMLPLGPNNAWDDGQLYTARAPILVGDQLYVYYGACNGVHGTATRQLSCAIGLATLRRDGFASLDAASTPGTVTTHPLVSAGGMLHVNYSTSGGSLAVEVLDENQNVIPGYSAADCTPLTGDSTDQIVTWDAVSNLPPGYGTLRLRFVLQNASLYSFAAGEGVVGQPPAITSHPASQPAVAGDTVSFHINATGTAPLTHQWQRSGVDLTDDSHVTGATTATLTLYNVGIDDLAAYRCVVSNPYGTAASNTATLTLHVPLFTGVGALPGQTASTISGVTADGSVVSGSSGSRGFIWTRTDAIMDLGLPAGATSCSTSGVAVGPGGNLVVAVNTNTASSKAKKWTGTAAGVGTFASLPLLAGTLEWTTRGIGASGSDVWIAGSSFNGGAGGGRRAGRYRQSTNDTAGFTLPANGHDHSDFHAVADNGYAGGQFQYGGTAPGGGARNAMKYTGGSACTALNTLIGAPSTKNEAVVKAISRDGATQGGWSYYVDTVALSKPVVWRASSSPTAIPFIAGGDNDNAGEVLALNGDGSLAGGYTYRSDGAASGPREAFIWDATNGTRPLQGWLTTRYGLDLSGWNLQEVRALSSDASVIAGNGLHNGVSEGWVFALAPYTPAPPDITQQPAALNLALGDMAVFTVVATGDGTLTYQWQRNGVDLVDDGHFSGCATHTLTIGPVFSSDAAYLRCRVAHVAGQVYSDEVSLTVRGAGDLDGDGDVDLTDFGAFQVCLTGADVPQLAASCLPARLDPDADVDTDDYQRLAACSARANVPYDPACTDGSESPRP